MTTTAPPPARARSLAIAALVGLLAAISLAAVALAQTELDGKLRADREIRVPGGETITTDLYAFGGTITIDGTVEGDVVASGGTIAINGSVGGDVLAAGGTVTISGEVTGDVRMAGGQLTLSGSVGEDLMAAGGQVEVAAAGRVGEDLVLSAGQATVSGSVAGSITGGAGAYSRSGTVGGTDNVVVPEAEPVADQTTDRILDAVQHFVAVLIIGLLALWLAPRLLGAAESLVRRQPLVAAGWGVVALVGFVLGLVVLSLLVVVAAVLLAAIGLDALAGVEILVGIVAILGLVLAFVLSVGFLADVVIALTIVFLAGRATAPDRERGLELRVVATLAMAIAVVVILTSLPVVGGWIKLAVVLLGTGALLAVLLRRRRRVPPTGQVRVAEPGPA
jgi:cytoskeletal protein CcmA (bactofilin family)